MAIQPEIPSFDQLPQFVFDLRNSLDELSTLLRTSGILQPNSPQNSVTPIDEYKTRKEAAKILKISLPTLNELTKSGKLTGYRIGNRLRYKTADIDKVLTVIRTSNAA